MKQWHPVFAEILRPAVEGYYEVQTTVPVGDAPRQADFVLLRRTTPTPPPFRGLWRHLTLWNILEFKGPTVSPRSEDVELLVELGLGIDRRLRAGHGPHVERRTVPEAVSMWYLANHLGRRFIAGLGRKLGPLEALGPGLWCSRVLRRMIFWVSSIDLPVEEDALPLHIIGREPPVTEREVARLVVEHPELQQRYGGWMASLHSASWQEVENMARAMGKRVLFDIRPAIESLGLKHVIEQVGLERVIEAIGKKEMLKKIVAGLSPVEREDLKRLLE